MNASQGFSGIVSLGGAYGEGARGSSMTKGVLFLRGERFRGISS